jgi:hypothetical protein
MVKEAEVVAYVWKQMRGGKRYSLQVEANKRGVRIANKISKLAEGANWRFSGESLGGSSTVMFFDREFETESELKKWATEFPYNVIYEGTNGKQRPIG